MKRILMCVLVGVVWPAAMCTGAAVPAKVEDTTIAVYFSPKGGCTDAIVGVLKDAKRTVLVQAYSFTSAPIANALVEAHRRGVRVQVVLDTSRLSEASSQAALLANRGIPLKVDAQHTLAHDKIMILDREIVITGSFDFTNAAETQHAENLLIIENKNLAGLYTRNWEGHAAHAKPYAGRRR